MCAAPFDRSGTPFSGTGLRTQTDAGSCRARCLPH